MRKHLTKPASGFSLPKLELNIVSKRPWQADTWTVSQKEYISLLDSFLVFFSMIKVDFEDKIN